jgi:hypothetical protein
LRATRWVRFVVTFALGVAVAFGGTTAGAAPKASACQLLTTDRLRAALGSTFRVVYRYQTGTESDCEYDGIGPVRVATVEVDRGKQAKVVMAKALKVGRDTLKSVASDPPAKLAGLGQQAYYSLDRFLGEGSILVLDGTTFVAVSAVVALHNDTALVSKTVLTGLARQALARAK